MVARIPRTFPGACNYVCKYPPRIVGIPPWANVLHLGVKFVILVSGLFLVMQCLKGMADSLRDPLDWGSWLATENSTISGEHEVCLVIAFLVGWLIK